MLFTALQAKHSARVARILVLLPLVALPGCGSAATEPRPVEAPTVSSTPGGTASGAATSPAAPSPSPTGAAIPTFVVSEGTVRGPERITATLGDKVAFSVSSDRADDVHVHGYNRVVPVRPGRPAIVRLRADIPGVFEVELEDSHLTLTRLRVTP